MTHALAQDGQSILRGLTDFFASPAGPRSMRRPTIAYAKTTYFLPGSLVLFRRTTRTIMCTNFTYSYTMRCCFWFFLPVRPGPPSSPGLTHSTQPTSGAQDRSPSPTLHELGEFAPQTTHPSSSDFPRRASVRHAVPAPTTKNFSPLPTNSRWGGARPRCNLPGTSHYTRPPGPASTCGSLGDATATTLEPVYFDRVADRRPRRTCADLRSSCWRRLVTFAPDPALINRRRTQSLPASPLPSL